VPLAPLYPAAGLYPGTSYPSDGTGWLYPLDGLHPSGSIYPGQQPDAVVLTWPDVERAVCDLLAGLGSTGTETRPSLQTTLPYIRVTRTGGSDDGVTDAATISVDVFAQGATQAKAVAEQARQLLAGSSPGSLPARQTDHGVVDRVITNSGPVRLPATDSAGLRMAVASYRVSMRRQAS
jgi:hypothetical protein